MNHEDKAKLRQDKVLDTLNVISAVLKRYIKTLGSEVDFHIDMADSGNPFEMFFVFVVDVPMPGQPKGTPNLNQIQYNIGPIFGDLYHKREVWDEKNPVNPMEIEPNKDPFLNEREFNRVQEKVATFHIQTMIDILKATLSNDLESHNLVNGRMLKLYKNGGVVVEEETPDGRETLTELFSENMSEKDIKEFRKQLPNRRKKSHLTIENDDDDFLNEINSFIKE